MVSTPCSNSIPRWRPSCCENLVDLQKDKSFDYSGRTNTGEGRFTSGECPIYMTSSAFYPNVKANAKFNYTAVADAVFPGRHRARRRIPSSAARRCG